MFSTHHSVRQNEYRLYRLSHWKLRYWETLLWPEGIRPLSERKIICAFSNLNFTLSWASQYVPDKLSILYWSLRTEGVRGEPFLGCLFVFVTLSSFTIIKCQQNSSCFSAATHRYFLNYNRVIQTQVKFKHSCLQYSFLKSIPQIWHVCWKGKKVWW